MPAIVDRDPIIVAIGTEGAAPILAREIKAKIESWLPATFGQVAQRAQALRRRVQEAIADPIVRRRTWEALLQGRWRKAILDGDDEAADREFDASACRRRLADEAPVGSVALIGCGPGEPDLITLKAQQHLQSADVLVVDRLVNPAILEYARRDAIRIDVGKEPEGNSALQDEINRILVREAMKGHRVVRLKGGDAFVFGRAAEEMAAVRAAGIACRGGAGHHRRACLRREHRTAGDAAHQSAPVRRGHRRLRRWAAGARLAGLGAARPGVRHLHGRAHGAAFRATGCWRPAPQPRDAGRHRRERHAGQRARCGDGAGVRWPAP